MPESEAYPGAGPPPAARPSALRRVGASPALLAALLAAGACTSVRSPDELRRDVELTVAANLDLLRIHAHVTRAELYEAADEAGLWTLQTSIFPENRASLALHHSAGYRTLGVRERIGRHHGVWRDTVFLERRAAG